MNDVTAGFRTNWSGPPRRRDARCVLLVGSGFDRANVLPVVFHTLSNAVSVTTATGVIGDEVVSQVGLLIVVWAVVAVLVWQYGTERLASEPLPDGSLDFVGPNESKSSGTSRGDVPGDEQS